jgi:cytochrome P450
MIMSPANCEHVLKTNSENYIKGSRFRDNLGHLLASGIFTQDGPAWRDQRKLFSHLFSDNSFRFTILAALVEHGASLERHLAGAAASGQPLDMQALFHAFTLDSIGSIAFGASIGALESPSMPFAVAFDQAQATCERRFFTPGWQLLRWALPGEQQLAAQVATIDAYCAKLIQGRRAGDAWQGRTDVLSRAMAMEAEGGAGQPLYRHDDKMLRDLVLNFLIAGRDTTAQALSWAILLIARHPEVAAALAAEADALQLPEAEEPAADSASFSPSYAAVASLRYTKAVMQESLRLFPSVPKDLKEVVKDDVLPDGTKVLAGSLIAYLPYVMGRSPQLWGEDAELFKPERFLSEKPVSAWKLLAFNGAGPRACLGQNMALFESAFVLALIFRSYTVELSPAEQRVLPKDSLTMPQLQGVTVLLKRRSRS